MVLEGEENETVRVLLENRLVLLELEEGVECDRLLFFLVLGGLNGLLKLGDVIDDRGGRRVLLVGDAEVEGLDGRVAHLESLERGNSL